MAKLRVRDSREQAVKCVRLLRRQVVEGYEVKQPVVEARNRAKAQPGTIGPRSATMASNTGCASVGELRDDAVARRRSRSAAPMPRSAPARASLHFLEQPHVLDGDHRLVGEGGDELDLPVGERFDRRAAKEDDADGPLLRASVERPRLCAGTVRLPDLFGTACTRDRPGRREYGPCDVRASVRPASVPRPSRNRIGGQKFDHLLREAVIGGELERRALRTHDRRHLRLAEPCRRLDQRIQHRLQVEGRSG